MKKNIGFILFVLMWCIPILSNAQPLPKCIKKVDFYVRSVQSGGAYPSDIVNLDGTVVKAKSEAPVFEYFLFVETATCKKLNITTLAIDGIRYTYQIKTVSSPVMVSEGNIKTEGNVSGKIALVKKSKNKVFQLSALKPAATEKKSNYHSMVLRGTADGKSFSITTSAIELSPVVAQ